MFAAPVRVMILRLPDESGRERRLARQGERGAATTEVRETVQEILPPGAYLALAGAAVPGCLGH
jgi:hypothetical protein